MPKDMNREAGVRMRTLLGGGGVRATTLAGLTLYLNTRGIRLIWRAMIAAVIASIAVVPAVVLVRPTLPHYPAAVVVAPVASGFGVTVALLWLIRWPTRGQSVLYALTGSVCIAAACLAQGDPLAGLLGSGAFAVLGGYIAFFHTAPYMMINFAIAMTTAVVLVERLIRYYDTVVAGCAFLLVLGAQRGVSVCGAMAGPFARQRIATIQPRRAHGSVDPPGLLSLDIRVVAAPPGRASYLGAAMIDLDNFKRLNDTHGHSTGDKALVAVAGALRLVCPPTTMIARFGGEEFVVADIYRTHDLHDIAEQLRKAIAATRYPITASIGIASAPLGASFDPAERELIDDLVNVADTAMYAAKRAGGNQSRSTHIAHAALKGSAA